jgi:nitroreductase
MTATTSPQSTDAPAESAVASGKVPPPDAPASRDRTGSGRVGPVKLLKRAVRRGLLRSCHALEDLSGWIQRRILRTTFERLRAEKHLEVPLHEMDQDLLGMYIRWNGHHVEKTVRYEKTLGRGWAKPVLLRQALDEWERRGYPARRWTDWAKGNLRDHEEWNRSGRPQIHSAKTLPTFAPDSPVMEVLKNRVSTRYWKDVPVEDEKINAILEAGVYAPTSCNRQTWKIYVHKKDKVEALYDVSNRALRAKAPVAMYITIDNRLYPEVWAPAEDAGIVGLQLNLAATALGLQGCLMYGAENFNQEQFRRDYDVPEYRYMYLMFLFGYADERTLTDKRVHADEVAIFI